ncbi:transcriptional regulator, SARP family [Catenulispora acidiphila DSM 44928]|uniref:Transcriptional regulator, SARP family n=1 Tax=Catenulispora acidiphila (strain DSM 44928 / JCM 14897 / NBRC 102108 / NRRL B-24433 / ID139908) TaxID=479433 RepID=C7QI28_CATAD|nr:AfsR/SARP family transcriptional regulator [Catenulispora acidiphila]ACU73073.1 transcriptional regulator, SARP family [Catenulispora acidiphila DSM 44928]
MSDRPDRITVRFTVLGPVSIDDGAQTVILPTAKPVSLLAAMLLRPNRVVPVDYLQNAVWGENAADTTKATLQAYILRLRRIFRKFGADDTIIQTLPGGYRLPVTAATLDLAEFRELTAAAGSAEQPEAELRHLRRALALWQGGPLANVQSEALHRDEVPVLEEEWLRTAERRFDVELGLGRHRDILADLRSATRAYPACERFREQLMEALYRTGRQADALWEYRSIKDYLGEELGVFPGRPLQQLELAILRGEELTPRPWAESRIRIGEVL